MNLDELTHRVIGIAMAVHREMGPGFLESIYHRCMELELAAHGLPFESTKAVSVFYKGKIAGNFVADLIISTDIPLLIELKAVEAIKKEHETQVVNYLAATGIEEGLILNFGAPSLQFKHKYRNSSSRPKTPNPPTFPKEHRTI